MRIVVSTALAQRRRTRRVPCGSARSPLRRSGLASVSTDATSAIAGAAVLPRSVHALSAPLQPVRFRLRIAQRGLNRRQRRCATLRDFVGRGLRPRAGSGCRARRASACVVRATTTGGPSASTVDACARSATRPTAETPAMTAAAPISRLIMVAVKLASDLDGEIGDPVDGRGREREVVGEDRESQQLAVARLHVARQRPHVRDRSGLDPRIALRARPPHAVATVPSLPATAGSPGRRRGGAGRCTYGRAAPR